MSVGVIEKLFRILQERKNADPEKSYVASLYKKGTGKIAEKVMEEAQETVDEALAGDKERLKEESADLLFHLMVLWAEQGLAPGDVLGVLEKRLGTGGHEEKAARKNQRE